MKISDNQAVRQLQPQDIWNHFSDLNAVPRPSKKEEKVIQFMLDFGCEAGLETFKDEIGNVIIRKPATPGMEDHKAVTLQSHLDMVHQKNSDTEFDFNSQGIQMHIDGDWVKAVGTTLGADNGIGVATIMAILKSSDIQHPPLEALFTIDEETGMTGAMGLKGGVLQGEVLLNLDTEEDDEIDIGCAGGIDVTATRAYEEEAVASSAKSYKISIRGLQGGHSGIDIHRGFGNANKIMNRLLYMGSESMGLRIAEIDGGSLRNAIPRESFAVVVIPNDEHEKFENEFEKKARLIKKELVVQEPDLTIQMDPITAPKKVMHRGTQALVLKSIYAAHNGVYAMSASIDGLVETSNNIARVALEQGNIKIGCLTRSSVESAKMDLAYALKSVFELGGFKVSFDGAYPGWNPNPDSAILKVLSQQYYKLFNENAHVVACHAGLECGILGQNYPDMDMISFGPTIKGAHSPEERVSITSVQKFWKFLIEILKNIPKK
jgi:dipeptidase D